MSFSSLPEKYQRELAQEYIEGRKEAVLENPYEDYTHMFGPPGLDEDGIIEWLKARDSVDSRSVMEGLAKESSHTPMLDRIRKAAAGI